MNISPEEALEREDSPASSLIGGSEGGKLAEYEEIAARAYDGFVVRKDLVGQVKGNAIVPSYVLEFLLAQYCATTSEAAIVEGIESVRRILAQHYVNRGDSELIKSRIREAGQYRIIDKVSVSLDETHDRYSASFENLGVTNALVSDATVRDNDRLLTGGVWCMADVSYVPMGDPGAKATSPWIVSRLQAIQLPRFDFGRYCTGRASFNTDQWIDLLVASVGLDPVKLSRRAKLFQLTRLIPYVERNYNLVELGPKGTGKSHIYSEFSPHGMLVSGGEVTLAKLFVNNATRRIGLVGYWDVVAFDEFAGHKRVERSLVDTLKNYLANKSFSRGDSTITAEASMVFVGNTDAHRARDVGHGRPVRGAPRGLPRHRVHGPHPLLPARMGDRHRPARTLLERVRSHRRLPGRGAAAPADPGLFGRSGHPRHARSGDVQARSGRRAKDLLGTGETDLPGARWQARGTRGTAAFRDRGAQASQGPDRPP